VLERTSERIRTGRNSLKYEAVRFSWRGHLENTLPIRNDLSPFHDLRAIALSSSVALLPAACDVT